MIFSGHIRVLTNLIHSVMVKKYDAGITQLVECKLPKLDVASSSLVARSRLIGYGLADLFHLFRGKV